MSYVDGTAAADWQRAAHLSNDKSQARIGPMASRRFSGTSMPRCRAQDRGFSSDGGKEDKDGSQQQFLDFAGTGGGTAPNRPGGLATSEGGVDTQSKTIPFRHASIDHDGQQDLMLVLASHLTLSQALRSCSTRFDGRG